MFKMEQQWVYKTTWTTATIDDVVTTVCHFETGNKQSSENRSTVIKEQQSNKMTPPTTMLICKNLTLTEFTNQTKDQSTGSDKEKQRRL